MPICPSDFSGKMTKGPGRTTTNDYLLTSKKRTRRTKKDPKACVRRLHQVVRWLDDVPQDYDMDFSKCVQINCATKYQRSIQRVPVVQFGNQKRLWQYYCPDTNAWCPYDGQVQSAIHRLFEEYRKGGYGIVKLRMPGRPEEYEINFVRGEQRNVTTGVSRKIQMT
eukprot:PhF_6_TR44220/c0_g2_i1/m.67931